MSQSRSLPSATAPSNSGARAHTRAYTKQLAELEPSLSLPTRQPEISPSFIKKLHPSTPPPSGRKHGRPQYTGSDTSSDDDENDEEFAFSAVDQPQVSDSDFQIPSITCGSVHHPLSPSVVISNPSSRVDSTSFFEPHHPPHHLPIHPQSPPPPFQVPLATSASLSPPLTSYTLPPPPLSPLCQSFRRTAARVPPP